nr:integrase, catalytic region, zinc finger, CCHC-type, peptidase aspartic, catalytic [Tanacetum cinerariifolium]
MCNECLVSVNHDKYLRNYVNDKNSGGKKQKAKVYVKEIQKKYQPKVAKQKKVGTLERLATPKPRKPRFLLRWSPTGRLFDQEGNLAASSNSESYYDCSNGNLKLLINFVWKFMGTVRFGNDHVAAILGFGDLQWGNILITRVYFIEGLGHNLFSVGQFYDSDLDVAFRRNAYFVRNLEGVKGDRSTNLYTINLYEMASASPIYLMTRASSTKSWLWHQRLSHLNFDTINDLTRNDLVAGLPKFKYHKEHLCPSCEQGKRKRASHPPKLVPNSRQRLHLLHMDLCGPMRISSINGKWYVLVIVDDYSRYTRNGVVKRRNRTLVEAARTMLIFSRAPLFLWAEAIATTCFTQNRSIIHHRFNKTPYELINGRKPDISFLHVFGALCYPKNDREDIGKLGAKGIKTSCIKKLLTTEVIDMAMGLTNMDKRYNGYVVNGFRVRTKGMDNSRVTQNSVHVVASDSDEEIEDESKAHIPDESEEEFDNTIDDTSDNDGVLSCKLEREDTPTLSCLKCHGQLMKTTTIKRRLVTRTRNNTTDASVQTSLASSGSGSTTSNDVRKKGRGPALGYQGKEKIKIIFSECKQPIRDSSTDLVNLLGGIGKCGAHAPLNIVSWKSMPDTNLDLIWQDVHV